KRNHPTPPFDLRFTPYVLRLLYVLRFAFYVFRQSIKQTYKEGVLWQSNVLFQRIHILWNHPACGRNGSTRNSATARPTPCAGSTVKTASSSSAKISTPSRSQPSSAPGCRRRCCPSTTRRVWRPPRPACGTRLPALKTRTVT